MSDQVVLPADTNQALGLARFAVEFMSDVPGQRGEPSPAVLERTRMFFVDACLCAVSAIALQTNAPTVLRREASRYLPPLLQTRSSGESGRHEAIWSGVPMLGSSRPVMVEKAILADVAAAREWDSNGTNFGYSESRPQHRAGEFGHNDFYAVPLAAACLAGRDGAFALRGMVLLDEIRGRLAEVFSLKACHIDHVLHGAIASACTFGAMVGAAPEEIESAVGMVVAHFVPFRAIRHGQQLSDSKGASAALSTEAAIVSVRRAIEGFVGPRDVFRNPQAVFNLHAAAGVRRLDAATLARIRAGERSPFDLVLSRAGDDFTIMGMHFKLGLYEHQSAGALQGVISLLRQQPALLDDPQGRRIARVVVRAYEPAFSIIGDPAKRDPRTRQSADHSMLYLVATLLRKALEARAAGDAFLASDESAWQRLMLLPHDFSRQALFHPLTRSLMARTTFEHGGPEYDRRYPDGIPTSVLITDDRGHTHDSGLVMYPAGHARNRSVNLARLLTHKWQALAALATRDPTSLVARFQHLDQRSARDLPALYDFAIEHQEPID